MRHLFVSILMITALLCQSCATIFAGSRQTMSFATEPAGAMLRVDGIPIGRTPVVFQLRKELRPVIAQVEAPGYRTETMVLKRQFETISLVNLLTFYGVGLSYAVDLITHSVARYSNPYNHLVLIPDPATQGAAPVAVVVGTTPAQAAYGSEALAQPTTIAPSTMPRYTIDPFSNNKDTIPYTVAVTFQPLSLLGQGLELGLEAMMPSGRFSLRANGGYFLGTKPFFYSDVSDYSGFRGEGQARFHFSDRRYNNGGFYMGVYGQAKGTSLTKMESYTTPNPGTGYPIVVSSIRKITSNAYGFGILLGWQKVYRSRFIMDMYIGGGPLLNDGRIAAEQAHLSFISPYNQGIQLHGGFAVGYAFGTKTK